MAISPTAEPTTGGEPSPKSWWLYLLLGIVLLIGGVFVLGDVVLASVISTIFIAWALVFVGAFQIVHAFSAVGWKGFVLDLLLGALYIAAGAILLTNPLAGTIKLTLLIGIIWIVSGLFRIVLSTILWRQAGWSSCFRASSARWREASSSPSGHSPGCGYWAFASALTSSSTASPGSAIQCRSRPRRLKRRSCVSGLRRPPAPLQTFPYHCSREARLPGQPPNPIIRFEKAMRPNWVRPLSATAAMRLQTNTIVWNGDRVTSGEKTAQDARTPMITADAQETAISVKPN